MESLRKVKQKKMQGAIYTEINHWFQEETLSLRHLFKERKKSLQELQIWRFLLENALSRGQNFERPFLQGRDLYLNFAVFSILYDFHKMIACISFYKSSKKYCDMFHMIRGLLAIEVEQSKQVTFLTPKNCREHSQIGS